MLLFFIFFLGQKIVFAELPHFIFIIADDLGWNDVSFHGSDQIPTPNIDALAYNGIILNHHYTPALCTPSRAALLTGKYPIHTGMQHRAIDATEPYGLGLNERLLPEVLSKAGYKRHAVGKWHLGYYKKVLTPTYRGFESHFGYFNGYQDYYEHILDSIVIPDYSGYDMRRNLDVDWSSKGKYSADLYNEEAVNIIKNHNTSSPLFLYFAHVAPHAGNSRDPFQAPEDLVAKFSYIKDPKRRYYAALVSKVDEAVGKVVSALDCKNMLQNSIIVFISDNGAPTNGIITENHGSNYPLRGMKFTAWEGGHRGVAAVWSPLIKKPQRVANQLMHIVDWMPTLYSLAGLDLKDLGDIDGVNMWEALSEDLPSPRTDFVYNIDDIEYPYAALRINDWKYVNGSATGDKFNGWYGESGRNSGITYNPQDVLMSDTNIAISQLNKNRHLQVPTILRLREKAKITCRNSRYKCEPQKSPCLFNIIYDPCEMVNLAKFRPDLLKTFEESLTKIRKTMVKARNKPGDCLSNPVYWNNTWTFWKDEKIDSDVSSLLSLYDCKP